MKIKEVSIAPTTIADLRPYEMFTIPPLSNIYMYIATVDRSHRFYLELSEGVWKHSVFHFNVNDPISIIEVETLEYKKRAV